MFGNFKVVLKSKMSRLVCSRKSRNRRRKPPKPEVNDSHSEHQEAFTRVFRNITRLMLQIEREKINNTACWYCNARRRDELRKSYTTRYVDESLEIQPCRSENYRQPLTLPPIYKTVELPVVQKRKVLFPTPCRGPIKDSEWSILNNCRYLRPGLPKYTKNGPNSQSKKPTFLWNVQSAVSERWKQTPALFFKNGRKLGFLIDISAIIVEYGSLGLILSIL